MTTGRKEGRAVSGKEVFAVLLCRKGLNFQPFVCYNKSDVDGAAMPLFHAANGEGKKSFVGRSIHEQTYCSSGRTPKRGEIHTL